MRPLHETTSETTGNWSQILSIFLEKSRYLPTGNDYRQIYGFSLVYSLLPGFQAAESLDYSHHWL